MINYLALNDEGVLDYIIAGLKGDFYVATYQGEQALVEILREMKFTKNYENIDNLIYLKDNKIIKTKSKEIRICLDENYINWNLFRDRIKSIVNVRTSVSCQFKCSFCTYHTRQGKYQCMSIYNIEKELDVLSSIKKVKKIIFFDDSFNIPINRFKKLLKIMIEKKYNFNWISYYRCQYADEEIVSMMKESGCEAVIMGLESGSREILKNMNKNVNINTYKECINLFHKYKILTEASFICGFLGETEETIKKTIRFIEETKPTLFRYQTWYSSILAPSNQIGIKYFKLKGSNYDWSHSTMNSSTSQSFVEEALLNIKNSIRIPHYNFELPGLFSMFGMGISVEDSKELMKIFNNSIYNKLKSKECNEISNESIERMKFILKKYK